MSYLDRQAEGCTRNAFIEQQLLVFVAYLFQVDSVNLQPPQIVVGIYGKLRIIPKPMPVKEVRQVHVVWNTPRIPFVSFVYEFATLTSDSGEHARIASGGEQVHSFQNGCLARVVLPN